MIRSTMNAVPRRTPAFVAKAIILAVISYVITTVAAAATFLIAMPVFHGLGFDLDWSTDGVMYSIFTGGLYVAGVALIGLSWVRCCATRPAASPCGGHVLRPVHRRKLHDLHPR